MAQRDSCCSTKTVHPGRTEVLLLAKYDGSATIVDLHSCAPAWPSWIWHCIDHAEGASMRRGARILRDAVVCCDYMSEEQRTERLKSSDFQMRMTALKDGQGQRLAISNAGDLKTVISTIFCQSPEAR